MSASPEKLAALRQLMAASGFDAAAAGVLPFGDRRIDAHLPGGGLPIGQLHEIGAAGMETQTGAMAAGFAACLAGALAAPQNDERPDRVLLWIATCCDLYAPGLLQYGIDPGRLILVRTGTDSETLQAMETALRSGAAVAVLGEVGRLPRLATRRLQLACLNQATTGFVLRRWPHGRQSAPPEGNAAATRWRLVAAPSGRHRNQTGPPCWQVDLLHARGGRPGSWIMQRREEADDERIDGTHPLRVVAVLGDDTAAPCAPKQGRADIKRRASG